jgi:hypothetical protein
MLLNRFAVTKLLITYSIAGGLFLYAAFAAPAQQSGTSHLRAQYFQVLHGLQTDARS